MKNFKYIFSILFISSFIFFNSAYADEAASTAADAAENQITIIGVMNDASKLEMEDGTVFQIVTPEGDAFVGFSGKKVELTGTIDESDPGVFEVQKYKVIEGV